MSDPVPLRDPDAEALVLGAMLTAPAVVDDLMARLGPDDFRTDRHRRIFAAITELHRRGEPVDAVTVKDRLRQSKRIDSQDALYLANLVEHAPVPEFAHHHARIVLDQSERRRLAEATSAATRALSEGADVETVRGELARVVQDGRAVAPGARVMGGWSFLAGSPRANEPVWGSPDQVLWSPGEPLLIVGPDGVGKTTLGQRLALARTGIRSPELLGFPAAVTDEPVLYVAADRPQQARRSLDRMVTEDDAGVLEDQLKVWRGPPPFDIGTEPLRLGPWIRSFGVRTVIIDALKDVARDLARDETGSAVVAAFTDTLASGIEVLVLHHQRKATGDNRKPRTLADVYGSRWITAGAGSVVLLWGNAGDPVVDLIHLKQPAGEVGPFRVALDHRTGAVSVDEGTDLLGLLVRSPEGMTAKEAARVMHGKDDRSAAERARRQLERLRERNLAHRIEGETPVRYVAAARG